MSTSPDSVNVYGQKASEHEDTPTAAEDGSLPLTETHSQPDNDDTLALLYGQMKQHRQEGWRHPDNTAGTLYDSMREVLRGLGLLAAIERERRLHRIENLIAQNDSEFQMDDCVRWCILIRAVDDLDPHHFSRTGGKDVNENAINEIIHSEDDARILVIYIITKIAPYLAFGLYYPSGRIFFYGKLQREDSRCEFGHVHMRRQKSPFHVAVDGGHYKAIRHMINHGSTFSWGDSSENTHNIFLKILREPPLGSRYKSYSTLRIAAKNEEHGLQVIKVLLSSYPAIAAPPDETFGYALDEGRVEILKEYLQYEDLKDMFITHENILRAIEVCEVRSSKVSRDVRMDIAITLITHVPKSVTIGYEIIEKVIQLNLLDFWHRIRPLVSELNASPFLHFAVRHQSVEFVNLFLREYPDSITYQWEGKYPLWHNNSLHMEQLAPSRSSEEELKRQTIRDILVSAIIKKTPTISDILDVLHSSGEAAKEICLDLSGFQSATHSMSDLFHGLMNQNDHTNLLSYERSLRYVEFPALALVAEEKKMFDSSIQSEHKEIFDVLEWLQDVKRVENIWELIVRDRLFSPHNEVEIGKHVGRFNVEALNWKMLDMSISIFEEESTGNIRELCLYASGKRAVISHWLSSEGVSSLPRLEGLNIYIIQDLMTKENCRTTFAYVSEKFSELSEKINEKRRLENREELFVNVNIEGWDPVYEEKLPELEEISERVVPKLSQFTKTYCNLVQDIGYESYKYRPSRIAIIDNGMLDISSNTDNLLDIATSRQQLDARHPKGKQERFGRRPNDGTLWSRIKEGRSFVDDGNRVSQWFLASDPHGTQMARIIGSIDPCCELYVARVSSGRSGITPSRVVKAIRWAISKDVDVISMSFALRQTTEELQNACREAANHGIAMLCSAHDEGTNLTHAYPADFPDTITITTCDEFGVVPPRNRHQSYEYAIDGQNVAVGIVPFLNSTEFVSGSSVATAIAAGLSSLILSCNRLARREDENFKQGDHTKIVKYHLQKMAVNESKFVQPEKFAGIDRYVVDGRYYDMETILHEVFLKNLY